MKAQGGLSLAGASVDGEDGFSVKGCKLCIFILNK
jgi:hypothetical protein